ncbi:hypothetical protein QNI24_02815 [Marinicella sp. X102]|nr:hypothetical protein [Marinicella marina]
MRIEMWSEIKGENRIGSEGGEIINDYEHSLGARVTLEKNGDVAPFSITVGVYGSFFHTVYMGSLCEGVAIFKSMKSDIGEYLNNPQKAESSWVENFVNRY